MLEKTKEYAINCHKKVNHFYDTMPYDFHLNMVYETAKKLNI
ncbi:hypothetical protein [uncultured Maribacter sp.]|nr:hypothetical protein [uncultured Maribacter sp.]